MVAQEGTPALTGRAAVYLGHVLGDGRLSYREAEFEQLAMDARRAPKHILNTHPSDQRPQTGIDARPAPRFRDFQRQSRRKPARCQRTSVSGRMIVMALRIAGNQRYSWMKNSRSLFVNWTRPRTLRCSTLNCCLSAAFSASSRLLDLKSEETRFKNRKISPTIVADVKRFSHQIKRTKFSAHTGREARRRGRMGQKEMAMMGSARHARQVPPCGNARSPTSP